MGVVILDCGAQYAKVIDRRVRELGIHSDILPVNTPASKLQSYEAIIISGGPSSVYEKGTPRAEEQIFELGKPVLGICYGMQLMAYHFDGVVKQKHIKEYGETNILIQKSRLFSGLERKQQVLMSHGDSVDSIPGFSVIATSGDIIAGIENKKRKMYGVQFHPEVDLTLNGKKILKNFLYSIANVERTHSLDTSIRDSVSMIRKTVGKNNVVSLISGGVDSAVTTALLLKALKKDQVYAIHIDHGFMRKNESKTVMRALEKLGLKYLKLVNAQEEFLNGTTKIDGKQSKPLTDVTDPEVKRKIIGDLFMRISDRELQRIPGKVFLAQGTLRPDLIESASELVTSSADTIKTHHNDSPQVREKRKQGLVIETNRDWHKDEVRKIAKKLGLPESIAHRQPFPGPGLAIRLLCGKPGKTKLSEKVNKIAKRYGLRGSVLPIKSVGVQGDGRSYKYMAVLQGKLSWISLKEASQVIPREIHDVNRVCYSFDPIPELTKIKLDEQHLDVLREADFIVNNELKPFRKSLAQVPVVLLPGNIIVLRPFVTNDFMTGRAAVIGKEIPLKILKKIVTHLHRKDISCVMYDLTSKPPGTTEWE